MSHGKIRHEKDCLNCGHYVEEKFCPHCGQENSEPRKPFHYLFTHFFEDLTHYDGQFWGTIKNLLFKPGKLTNTYLEGKRQMFVPPVKLYIFVSFVTFFLPSLFPKENKKETAGKEIKTEAIAKEKQEAIAQVKKLENLGILTDENSKKAIEKILSEKSNKDNTFEDDYGNSFSIGTKSLEEYDEEIKKSNSFLDKASRPFAVKFFELKKEGMTSQQFREKFNETFIHSLPKALFIYLPIFAFILWIFHNKRKWWYFDHGVFTLHYFSFLLICTLIMSFISLLDDKIDNLITGIFFGISAFVITLYSMVYFFIAHHKVYQTKKRITILKGFLIFAINSVCMILLLLSLIALSFMMIH